MKNKKTSILSLIIKSGLVSGLTVLAVGFFLTSKIEAKVTLGEEERDLIEKINEYRKDKGLKELKISQDLSEAAEYMANDMADNPDSINHEHKDSKGKTAAERAALYGYNNGVGENLAAGYSTVDRVFKAWKGSVEHNENMIDPDFKVMGVAFKKSNNNYKWYWVNMFGDTEKKKDLLQEKDYGPLRRIKVTVTNYDGGILSKSKVTVWSEKRIKVASGRTNTKGQVSIKVEPRDVIYVRAIFSGYSPYTKKIKLSEEKGTVNVKLWLERT